MLMWGCSPGGNRLASVRHQTSAGNAAATGGGAKQDVCEHHKDMIDGQVFQVQREG